MVFYHLVITVLLLIVLANVINNLRCFRAPPLHGLLPDPLPLVSVLVPARNEERNIARCLDSLLGQDYARLEVIVLDDNSSDHTAQIVAGFARRDPRVRLLRGQPLPPGWHGKAYACQQMAEVARGDWLLFTDADTVHAPGCVSASLRAAVQEGADLLTYIPYLVTGTFWEKVMMPLMAFFPLFLMPLPLVARGEPLFSMAVGTFLLFPRATYWRIGGHAAVRQEITEDMVLGRLVKRHGGRLALLDGKDVLSVRFYHNLGEVWRGFAKSSYYAYDFVLLGWLGVLVLVFLLFVRPYSDLFLALEAGKTDWLNAGLPLLQVAMMWSARLLMARRLRLDAWPCLLHGVMVLVTIGIVLHSLFVARLGLGTVWKGRAYSFEGDVLTHHQREP